MPIKKNAMKAMRQTKTATVRNSAVKENLNYLRRMFRKAVEAKETKKAAELGQKIIKATDKSIQNGVIKLNTGSRIKSRLMANLKTLNAKK